MESINRVPPQNLEAEQAVLGAMLIDKEAMVRAVELIHAEDFYKESNRLIFQAILTLYEKGNPADLVTLTEALRQEGQLEKAGGVAYLVTLTTAVPTSANLEYYANIVAEKALYRMLIEAGTKIAQMGYEAQDEAYLLVDEAEQLVFSLSQQQNKHTYMPLKSILIDTFDHIESLYSKAGQVTGVPTGFADFDEMTSGLQPSDLVILAARPSMGKTMFCLNIARNAALTTQKPVVIFSLEMSREQLALRLLCAEAVVNSQHLRTGDVKDDEWERLGRGLGRLGEAPIFIDDTPSISALDIRARARRIKAEHDLGLIVIDYLQLMQMRGRTENRQQEISVISRSLKALARELHVPVVALSQLSRAVEQRQDKKPMLSDLRESGALEQDADVVGFLYREEYYNPESEMKDIAELIIAKQRNGPTGTIKLLFRKDYGRFESLSRRPE